MLNEFNLLDTYEQNLNFLFGAGASYGFLPTLSLGIKDDKGNACTFETLAKYFDEEGCDSLRTLLFMHYYQQCIKTGLPQRPVLPFTPQRRQVLDEYKTFLTTLVAVLEKQGRTARKANIYTTNYDSCFEVASDELLKEHIANFVVNDGSAGFQRRSFHTKNFNQRVVHKGIFDKHDEYLPQINILHSHGSVYWEKGVDGAQIDLNYYDSSYHIQFEHTQLELLNVFSDLVNDGDKTLQELMKLKDNININHLNEFEFWARYKKIPIVNPTKWKFHETVFEEAYYQILRHLSYELERPNTVLITFGFSFADEHILHLVQRSLSNPSLTVYISCFNEVEKTAMQRKFGGYKNIKYIVCEHDLIFKNFNENVFTLNKKGDE